MTSLITKLPGNEVKSSFSSCIEMDANGKFWFARCSLTGLGALETDGEGVTDPPALRNACLAFFLFNCSTLFSSSSFHLASRASGVKLGIFFYHVEHVCAPRVPDARDYVRQVMYDGKVMRFLLES